LESRRRADNARTSLAAPHRHLIIFPGHHEYVTKAEYDAVERYRDLGGNLAFLAAKNFMSGGPKGLDNVLRWAFSDLVGKRRERLCTPIRCCGDLKRL
jgi:hypothetical protein